MSHTHIDIRANLNPAARRGLAIELGAEGPDDPNLDQIIAERATTVVITWLSQRIRDGLDDRSKEIADAAIERLKNG